MSKKMMLISMLLSFMLLLVGCILYYLLPKTDNISNAVEQAVEVSEDIVNSSLDFNEDIFKKTDDMVYEYIKSTYNPPAAPGAASVVGRVYFVKSKVNMCDTKYMSTMIGRHANRSLVGKDVSYYSGASVKNPYEISLLIDKFHKGEMTIQEKEQFNKSYRRILDFNNKLTNQVLELYNTSGVTCKLSKEDVFMELLVLT